MKKPEAILKIEKEYGVILKEISLKENILRYVNKNTYQINNKGDVFGLNLRDNQISEIKNLEELKQLSILDLSGNQISEIKNLEELKQLSILDLSNNQISKIKNLEELKQLSSLDLSNNQISEINNLEELKQLSIFYLSDNQISEIKNLEELKQLSSLNLSFNKISEIKNLEELKQLSSLDLYRNKISEIKNLEELKHLSVLNLKENKISEIKNLEELKQLSSLDLSYNNIEEINKVTNVLKNKNLKFLSINNNPFLNKSTIVLESDANHIDIIKNELKKLESKKSLIKLPIKICLLGNHKSGKTTFLNYFVEKKILTTNSTHILNILSYPKLSKELPEAIFFDFGGQDYYHGVYKAFLTNASTNMLFWNEETDKNQINTKDSKGLLNVNFDRKYWLGQLDYFENLNKNEKDNEKNVYQIQTHSDKNSQNIYESDSTLRFYYISLDKKSLSRNKYKYELDALREEILDLMQNRPELEKSEDEIKLYTYITIQKEKENKIPIKNLLKEYNKKTSEINLLQAELDQLSKKGFVLYYKDCEELKDVVWINPSKTVNEIHEILNEKILKNDNGEVDNEKFEEQFTDKDIIALLKYNKVIFLDEKSAKPKYIIPGYLTSSTDENDDYFIFGNFNEFNFSLKFENFIPFGFMNQLICNYGGEYEAKSYRKDQLVFTIKEKKVKVMIRLDFEKLLIQVAMQGLNENVNIKKIERLIFFDLLNLYNNKVIFSEKEIKIEELQEEKTKAVKKQDYIEALRLKNEQQQLENDIKEYSINFETYNKAPEDLYVSYKNSHYVHYKTLEDEEKTTSEIVAYEIDEKGKLEKDKIKTLPTLHFNNLSNNPKITKMKKVFISYSHYDSEDFNRLLTFLKPLERNGKISIWQDLKLKAGTLVADEILKKLEESDIVIMLISQDFISSDFIFDNELPKAMKKKLQSSGNIIPVVLTSSTIFDLDLDVTKDDGSIEAVKMGRYYFIPQDSKNNLLPIKDWGDKAQQDKAWKKVYDEIVKLL